jgi:hypothetical protein
MAAVKRWLEKFAVKAPDTYRAAPQAGDLPIHIIFGALMMALYGLKHRIHLTADGKLHPICQIMAALPIEFKLTALKNPQWKAYKEEGGTIQWLCFLRFNRCSVRAKNS